MATDPKQRTPPPTGRPALQPARTNAAAPTPQGGERGATRATRRQRGRQPPPAPAHTRAATPADERGNDTRAPQVRDDRARDATPVDDDDDTHTKRDTRNHGKAR